LDALLPLPRQGRSRTLSEEEEQEIKSWIIGNDPRQYGFDFGLWTRQIVVDLIENRLGVKLSLNSVGRLLHRQGLTPQKPLRRAYERDEKAVTQWVKEVYPKVKKHAKKIGAETFWLDEASIRSDDPLQITWGKKEKLQSLKRVARGNQLMQFQPYQIKVVFGITFIQVGLQPTNVLSVFSGLFETGNPRLF